MLETQRRRRDPEARRREIVQATVELVLEVGVDAITHRMVAARADVPLGATTQYFATLEDLRSAALNTIMAEVEAQVVELRRHLAEHGTTPGVLAQLLHDALVDARARRADRVVVTAAVRDPKLRELARNWSAQIADLFATQYGTERATAAVVFINGILWHTQLDDTPLPVATMELALSGILGTTAPSSTAHV